MTYQRRPPKAAGKQRKDVPSLNEFPVRLFVESMASATKKGEEELYFPYLVLQAANKNRPGSDNQWELDWLVSVMCHSFDWSDKYARYEKVKQGIGIYWNKPRKGSDGIVRVGMRGAELVAAHLGTDMTPCLPFEIPCKEFWIEDECGCRSGNLRALLDSLPFARFAEPRPCSNAQVQEKTGRSKRTLQRRKSACVHLNTLRNCETVGVADTHAQALVMLKVARDKAHPRERGRYRTQFVNGKHEVVCQGPNSYYMDFKRLSMRYRPQALKAFDEIMIPADFSRRYRDPDAKVTKAGAEGKVVFVQKAVTAGTNWTVFERASEPTPLMTLVRQVGPLAVSRVRKHRDHLTRIAERMEMQEALEFLGAPPEKGGVGEARSGRDTG